MAEDAGFLGRWARRKEDARQGKALEEPAAAVPATPVDPAAPPTVAQTASPAPDPAATPDAAPPKVLTLDDARLLTKDSDFKPFMAGGVSPEVRNAAMKKLFADPHFNVMDGLDTYIDDYSKFEPIPESMLRQMVSAKFLKLFGDEDEDKKDGAQDDAVPPRESANNPTAETVAQSSYENPDIAPAEPSGPPETSQPVPPVAGSQQDHAHTDLRLQPDHAAPAPGAGRGAQ
ncbi:DUF3306 domain-containing protein [Polaromonas sp. LjRoot131]|uniref:DUF3306 domain-containing protein n=1 Tax=Polaromonas sp. LjRoot131 TaxID=3342262 RepID=UPI003ED15961